MSYPYEYLILFSPPMKVRDEISELKKQFRMNYGRFDNFNSIAHITVGNLIIPNGIEELFFNQLAEAIDEIECFTFTVDGFDAFANSRTIFAHLKESENFKRITQALSQVIAIHDLKKSSRVVHTPHLTIAKGLERRIFNKAYCFEYSFKSYKDTFDTCELTVLRKGPFKRKYEIFKKLPLLDLWPRSLSLA